MRALLPLLLLVVATGCLSRHRAPLAGKFQVSGPRGTTWEFGFHDYDYGLWASSAAGGSRILGRGCSFSVLNLVAWGDSSVGRYLMPEERFRGKANAVTHADVERLEISAFVPVFTRHCVTAYGE